MGGVHKIPSKARDSVQLGSSTWLCTPGVPSPDLYHFKAVAIEPEQSRELQSVAAENELVLYTLV